MNDILFCCCNCFVMFQMEKSKHKEYRSPNKAILFLHSLLIRIDVSGFYSSYGCSNATSVQLYIYHKYFRWHISCAICCFILGSSLQMRKINTDNMEISCNTFDDIINDNLPVLLVQVFSLFKVK